MLLPLWGEKGGKKRGTGSVPSPKTMPGCNWGKKKKSVPSPSPTKGGKEKEKEKLVNPRQGGKGEDPPPNPKT